MADILIKHLKAKAEEHSALATLLNQWGYDEKIIPKALQTVGNLFPHYSRHDESHCKQILINIERLLGDNIKLLTATDTWLLLEAAYWHDIGMVVPADALNDALNNPAFETYLDSIRNSPNHELHRFALTFDAKDLTKCFSGADTPLDALDKFRQLMAEWFRQSHATRSNAIVQDPWATVGISSPRTELIPARLYRLLGKICQMHGVPFSDLISDTKGLPFREAGMAQEDCHPRFVACLLRMGDLLDMDDNRFCPVMQRIAGENRPHLSKAHEHKHAAIRHLRMDRERIEVSAECNDIDGYIETFKWFDWLKQEMQDQMSHWQDIVPSRELGLLPTLGEISVRLAGEYQLLKAGERPQFTVDTAKAFELLQGSNLYNTKFACIRELLQNAIDATLLRIWATKSDAFPSREFNQENYDSFQKVFADCGVEVDLVEAGVPETGDAEKSVWRIHIKDKGTGISRADLVHMLRVGGSQRNTERQMLIKSMPEWLKPSGAFGIGLQSVFMVTDKISIITKSIFTNEQLEITMYSPTGANKGMVIIKSIPFNISSDCGTKIEFDMQIDRFAKRWSYNARESQVAKMYFLNKLDPVLSHDFPISAAEIADRIIDFSQGSIIPIDANLRDGDRNNLPLNAVYFLGFNNSDNWHFIEVNGYQLMLKYNIMEGASFNYELNLYFKGQAFDYKGLSIPNVALHVNLVSGKASEWLNASRDSIASSAEEALRTLILSALKIAVSNDVVRDEEKLKDGDFSLFINTMAIDAPNEWGDLAKRSGDAWLKLIEKRSNRSYSDFFKEENFFVVYKTNENIYGNWESLRLLEVSNDNFLYILWRAWERKDNRRVLIVETDEINLDGFSSSNRFRGISYRFSSNEARVYTDKVLAKKMINSCKAIGNYRYRLPLIGNKWERLHIKHETASRTNVLFNGPFHSDCNQLMLPFLFKCSERKIECTDAQLIEICKWVQPNLINPLPLEEIKKAYEELIEYIDNDLMKNTGNYDEWVNLRRLDKSL